MVNAIVAQGLRKKLGKKFAIDDLSLSAPEGTVLCLLGPNGAGKTTTVRMLATLMQPDAGRVEICGIDVRTRRRQVRQVIGLTGQFASVDNVLTGAENLMLIAQLCRIKHAEAKRLTSQALERFGLSGVGDDQVKTYSGGMRRRLDLAASMLTRPRVLFLDEPTSGLDLEARLGLWDQIKEAVNAGTTILLTTQQLDEADRLADNIVVLDYGKAVAEGSPEQLKSLVGGEWLEISLSTPDDLNRAVAIIGETVPNAEAVASHSLAQVTVPLRGEMSFVLDLLQELRVAGIHVTSHGVRRPTLDDAFLTLTGHDTSCGSAK